LHFLFKFKVSVLDIPNAPDSAPVSKSILLQLVFQKTGFAKSLSEYITVKTTTKALLTHPINFDRSANQLIHVNKVIFENKKY
jgi:hypothetical protein